MQSEFDLDKGNAIVAAMRPEDLKAAMASWSAFLRLPWDAQKAIEQAHPAGVKQLRDRFYGTSTFGPGR